MRQASKASHINWEIELSTDQIRKNRRKPSIQGGPTQIARRRRKNMINQHRKTEEHPLPITTKSTNPRPHGTPDASKTHEFSKQKNKIPAGAKNRAEDKIRATHPHHHPRRDNRSQNKKPDVETETRRTEKQINQIHDKAGGGGNAGAQRRERGGSRRGGLIPIQPQNHQYLKQKLSNLIMSNAETGIVRTLPSSNLCRGTQPNSIFRGSTSRTKFQSSNLSSKLQTNSSPPCLVQVSENGRKRAKGRRKMEE